MHLKLETLPLNDDNDDLLDKVKSIPSQEQIRDDVLLLWREEPNTEDLNIADLHQKTILRNPSWKLSQESFINVLTAHNLYATEDKELKGYVHEINFPEIGDSLPAFNIPSGLDILTCPDGNGRGLFTNRPFEQGELILKGLEPLVTIPPIEKLSLAQLGKVCSLCGSSVMHSSHFIIMNGLDCSGCSAIWCSGNCKKHDTTHDVLKHIKGKNKSINPSAWARFETYCKENVFVAAYAIGIIFAAIVTEGGKKGGGETIFSQFRPLAEVSQRIRRNVSDSTNLGGTFDASSGAVATENPEPVWRKAHDLFHQTFPDTEMDFDRFLTYIGKYNINQVNGQIYPLYSLINHDCEPNVRFEIDNKLRLQLYARKSLKAGDELFTTYVNPLHGSRLRRRELRVNWGFLCHCNRCTRELDLRKAKNEEQPNLKIHGLHTQARRKSSMRHARPDLHELLKNGKEFELDIPENPTIGNRRRTSVRFDSKVIVAVEE